MGRAHLGRWRGDPEFAQHVHHRLMPVHRRDPQGRDPLPVGHRQIHPGVSQSAHGRSVSFQRRNVLGQVSIVVRHGERVGSFFEVDSCNDRSSISRSGLVRGRGPLVVLRHQARGSAEREEVDGIHVSTPGGVVRRHVAAVRGGTHRGTLLTQQVHHTGVPAFGCQVNGGLAHPCARLRIDAQIWPVQQKLDHPLIAPGGRMVQGAHLVGHRGNQADPGVGQVFQHVQTTCCGRQGGQRMASIFQALHRGNAIRLGKLNVQQTLEFLQVFLFNGREERVGHGRSAGVD